MEMPQQFNLPTRRLLAKLAWFRARDLLTNFRKFNMKKGSREAREKVTWSPPTARTIKINVDVVLLANSGGVGLGLLVRNERGEVYHAVARTVLYNSTVEHAAILWVVEVPKEKTYVRVEVEVMPK